MGLAATLRSPTEHINAHISSRCRKISYISTIRSGASILTGVQDLLHSLTRILSGKIILNLLCGRDSDRLPGGISRGRRPLSWYSRLRRTE